MVLQGAIKTGEVLTQGKMIIERNKKFGQRSGGKLRPWGGDPACWRHNKGQQQGQEPEPQPPQGQAILPTQVRASARRLCVHANDLVHALN